MTDVVINIRGKPMTLTEIAEYSGLPYKIVYKQFRNGVRDESIMEWPDSYVPRTLADVDVQEIRDLCPIRYAWIGMKDGWRLACDLLGIPRTEAKQLKKVAESIWFRQ